MGMGANQGGDGGGGGSTPFVGVNPSGSVSFGGSCQEDWPLINQTAYSTCHSAKTDGMLVGKGGRGLEFMGFWCIVDWIHCAFFE